LQGSAFGGPRRDCPQKGSFSSCLERFTSPQPTHALSAPDRPFSLSSNGSPPWPGWVRFLAPTFPHVLLPQGQCVFFFFSPWGPLFPVIPFFKGVSLRKVDPLFEVVQAAPRASRLVVSVWCFIRLGVFAHEDHPTTRFLFFLWCIWAPGITLVVVLFASSLRTHSPVFKVLGAVHDQRRSRLCRLFWFIFWNQLFFFTIPLRCLSLQFFNPG